MLINGNDESGHHNDERDALLHAFATGCRGRDPRGIMNDVGDIMRS